MAEYIEREKAIDYLMEIINRPNHPKWVWTDEICGSLKTIPAADVRPVVLCRDCKHNMANIPDIQDGININENWNACQLTELYDSVKPDDFCSHGEKREES